MLGSTVDVGLRAVQFHTGLQHDGMLLVWEDREFVSVTLLDMDGK